MKSSNSPRVPGFSTGPSVRNVHWPEAFARISLEARGGRSHVNGRRRRWLRGGHVRGGCKCRRRLGSRLRLCRRGESGSQHRTEYNNERHRCNPYREPPLRGQGAPSGPPYCVCLAQPLLVVRTRLTGLESFLGLAEGSACGQRRRHQRKASRCSQELRRARGRGRRRRVQARALSYAARRWQSRSPPLVSCRAPPHGGLVLHDFSIIARRWRACRARAMSSEPAFWRGSGTPPRPPWGGPSVRAPGPC